MAHKRTTQERQQRTRQQQLRRQVEHNRCEMTIRQNGPHWGLYCREHGTWIQWLRQDQLIALGHLPKDHWEQKAQARAQVEQWAREQQDQESPAQDSWG